MTVAEILRCAGPHCGRPIERAATGRPGRYCSASCRQGAYRERERRAEEVRRRAADLADARRAVALIWPRLETASLDVSEDAGSVLNYAAVEDPADRGALAYKLAELRAHVDRLERLALDFRRADERLTALGGRAG